MDGAALATGKSHPLVSGTPHPDLLPSKGRRDRNAVVRLPSDLLCHEYFQKGHNFSFSKTLHFSGKFVNLRPVALGITANALNLYGAILIFREFSPSDPLPTPVF
jgi:hypothetical protein